MIGIVASRLVELHHRPVIVISLDEEGGGRGSGRSIPGFDLLAGLEACSEHLVGFGGHRAAAGLELRAEDVNAFREAFAAHAAEVLGPEELTRTQRIDAMVGGADLGLELAEELGRLAPFGMGNPGVRLLVPAAHVRDVRPMGEEGKHARFSLHSGSHRALGVSFGRSNLGVGEDDAVDAAVRLEVNRWNGSIEPRVVLNEIYPCGEDVEAAERDASERWWERFEAELSADLPPPTGLKESSGDSFRPVGGAGGSERRMVACTGSAAALLAELTSAGEEVLALVADRQRRASLRVTGARIAEYAELELSPELASGFAHVVLVDPPANPEQAELATSPGPEGGYLHRAWGERERRLAIEALAAQLAQRSELIAFFREMREAGEAGDSLTGERLQAALRGSGPQWRAPAPAARCFRVLAEVGLLRGTTDRGGGTVGVVSSDKADLENSAAYRAYSARFQEGRKYLEGLKQS